MFCIISKRGCLSTTHAFYVVTLVAQGIIMGMDFSICVHLQFKIFKLKLGWSCGITAAHTQYQVGLNQPLVITRMVAAMDFWFKKLNYTISTN